MIDQESLFDLISRDFDTKPEFHRAIADVLHVEVSNARKRANGTTILRYDELDRLANAFPIVREKLFVQGSDRVDFSYIPLNKPSSHNYRRYIEKLAANLETAAADTSSQLYYVADEVPIFHFMRFPELTIFKLYAYAHDMKLVTVPFETYRAKLERMGFLEVFERIHAAYRKISSVEIWDRSVLDLLLSNIRLKNRLNCFGERNTIPRLLDQTEEMVQTFRHDIEAERNERGIKVEFFVNEGLNRLPYMLIKNRRSTLFTLKLQTVNSMSTAQPEFLAEAEDWFEASISRSAVLGWGSDAKRHLYFQGLHGQIETERQRLAG